MWVVTVFKEHESVSECFHSKRDAENFIYSLRNKDWCYMLNYSRMF